jgi:hypothetical protein
MQQLIQRDQTLARERVQLENGGLQQLALLGFRDHLETLADLLQKLIEGKRLVRIEHTAINSRGFAVENEENL